MPAQYLPLDDNMAAPLMGGLDDGHNLLPDDTWGFPLNDRFHFPAGNAPVLDPTLADHYPPMLHNVPGYCDDIDTEGFGGLDLKNIITTPKCAIETPTTNKPITPVRPVVKRRKSTAIRMKKSAVTEDANPKKRRRTNYSNMTKEEEEEARFESKKRRAYLKSKREKVRRTVINELFDALKVELAVPGDIVDQSKILQEAVSFVLKFKALGCVEGARTE